MLARMESTISLARLPDADPDPAGYVTAVSATARRFMTPCGEGTMAWRAWGSGPPLVVGHGAQGAWSHWIRNIAELARARTVIAPDLPGHGDSALPDDSDHASMTAALAAGLPLLTDGEPVDMAGFSLSGTVFAHFAAAHPDMVRRLVLIGCGGLDTAHGPIDIGPVRGLEGEAKAARLRANLLGLMLHADDAVDPLALHLLVANARMSRLADAQRLVIPDRLLRILPHVRAQVDAIWGEFDRPHPVEAGQEAALRTVDPRIEFRVIPGAGHWAMYERPDAFNAALLEMLDRPLRPVQKDRP